MTTKQPVGWITPTGQLFPLSSYRPEQKLAYDAHKAGWRHVVVDEPIPAAEPVARVVSSGPEANLPCLQWLSADHSLRTSIGALLFASAADVEPAEPPSPTAHAAAAAFADGLPELAQEIRA